MNKTRAEQTNYCLEDMLCQFEDQWNIEAGFDGFLPHRNHPNFGQVLTEFIRVDMELRFNAGQEIFAGDYFGKFPELASDNDAKSSIVFEEFRLRNINGESVSSHELAQIHGVDPSSWPEVDFENGISTTQRFSRLQNDRLNRSVLPKIGDTFVNFRIIGKLGEGAYGTVMLAQQDDLAGRLTVLKFVPRFSDEHSFLARLQHSHIVPVYSVHDADEFMAICMPFMGVATLQDLNGSINEHSNTDSRMSVEGQALIQTTNKLKEKTIEQTISNDEDLAIFKKRNRLDFDNQSGHSSPMFRRFAATTVLAIAEGLAYAHEHGIVHGDLKPANILLDDDGKPVILDFHLANSQADRLGKHVGGTLAYMSPEHFEAMGNEQPVGAATDVYSVGLILFELITGRLPFPDPGGNNVSEFFAVRKRGPLICVEDRNSLGHDLVAIVEKCLSANPEERYQHAGQLAADLQAHLDDRPLKHARDVHWSNRIAKWARRNPRLSSATSISIIAAVLLFGISISFFALSQRLAKVESVNLSRNFVSDFEIIRQPLATYVYFDSNHFDQAIQSANDALTEFGWNTPHQLLNQERARWIGDDQLKRERQAALELHAWVAEGYQRQANDSLRPNVQQRKLLEKAQYHNQLAFEFREPDQRCEGLKLQRRRIQSFLSGEPDDTEFSVADTPESTIDKTLTAFQLRFDDDQSRKLWLEVLEEDPTDVMAWLCLGQNHYRSRNWADAKACFTVCIGMEPDNAYSRIFRAMSTIGEGRELESAIQDLKIAEQSQPDDLVIIQNLALAYGKLRQFQDARDYYDRAIDLGTTNTRVWYLRSRINAMLGNDEDARQDLEYFVAIEPSDAESWRTRGTTRISQDPRKALDDFNRALELKPDDVVTINNMAHIYSERLKDLDKAIALMDQVVMLEPESAQHCATRGVLLARKGDRDAAINAAKKSLKLDRSADTLYRVAGIYAQTSRTHEADANVALVLLKGALSRDPQRVIRMMKTDPDLEPIKNRSEMGEIDALLTKIEEYSKN